MHKSRYLQTLLNQWISIVSDANSLTWCYHEVKVKDVKVSSHQGNLQQHQHFVRQQPCLHHINNILFKLIKLLDGGKRINQPTRVTSWKTEGKLYSPDALWLREHPIWVWWRPWALRLWGLHFELFSIFTLIKISSQAINNTVASVKGCNSILYVWDPRQSISPAHKEAQLETS